MIDVGAGTGIASRQLRSRGARVVAVEPDPGMATVLREASPDVALVRADGNALPFAGSSVDLVTYAQSFHWTDPARSVPEAFRVTGPEGALAVWWNMPDTAVSWVALREARLRAACPGYAEQYAVLRGGLPADIVRTTMTFPWQHRVPVESAVAEIGTRSHVARLSADGRAAVLAAERAALWEEFPDGEAVVPYLTTLQLARSTPP
ncbi:class I SAM-dependent methyltransferase [Streptomyces lavendulae]|uniref:class I SAM-dependent methyltransferase n=1 Tax=Streptomyces lavendulae TaxID=1914 RepID=UPI00367EFEA6